MSGDPNNPNLFTPGETIDSPPVGDVERQAIDSLRGYTYQVVASALAWLDLSDKGKLYLEVAEDYATIAEQALSAVQVKDTAGSGSVTLNTETIRDAIHAFIDLAARNSDRSVELRYLSTSAIGTEQKRDDRPGREAGLVYWRKAAMGADVTPLRAMLERETFSDLVHQFIQTRDDDALRRDLFRKIHWECGQRDLTGIRQELEERLIVFGRDRYQIPSWDAKRLADVLSYHVLKKSILKKAEDRALTRAELYGLIDAAAYETVPRGTLGKLIQLTAGASDAFIPATSGGTALSAAETGWLVQGKDLPSPRFIIGRPELEASIAQVLSKHGIAFLIGPTGLGKSIVARAASINSAGGFALADLRDTSPAEGRRRLDYLLGRVGAMESQSLILEDLNQPDDATVALSLSRVVEALRRRDRLALVTSYRRPSAKVLGQLGVDALAVVEIPYFSEAEAKELVKARSGDPDVWGRLAYVAGGHGHPQLVDAFVAGMANRGWPRAELRDVVIRGLTSGDIEAERESARRALTAALPADARNLLYRLSLTIGRFDRPLALEIGVLPPTIAQAGEALDELVGPWIEVVSAGHYRVSPLASGTGREMLAPEEQLSVHEQIAARLLSRKSIDASDASMILMHALLGKSTRSVVAIAYSVLRANNKTLTLLGEHFFMLRALRTESPVYPDSPAASQLLRLAQFKLISSGAKEEGISDCAAAVMREVEAQPNQELRSISEYMALATILNVMGIARHLPNWLSLLLRFMALTEENRDFQKMKNNCEKAMKAEGVSFYGSLFAIGASGIDSVEHLEKVFVELDAIDAKQRSLLLSAYAGTSSEYGHFVNVAWLAEHKRDAINAADASARYKRMADIAQKWGVKELALCCHVARAVVLDEYADDMPAALSAIDEAARALGNDIVLRREQAKILWRHDDHAGAVKILRDIADRVGLNNPIERAFALREAAISAAKTDDWRQAEIWFLEGQKASMAAHTVDMKAMSIGLGADAAVAAFMVGAPSRALEGLANCLVALGDLNPEASLRAGYCHRVVRHTVLWMESKLDNRETVIGGEPIGMLPGTCSNPEPLPSILELPLAPIDLAWYMLAEAEIAAGLDVGLVSSLPSRLPEGPIPVLETEIRNRWVKRAVLQSDPILFATRMRSWIEGMSYFRAQQDTLQKTFDIMSPTRGEIGRLDIADFSSELIQALAVDALLAFSMAATFNGKADAISELESALTQEFGGVFPGARLFKHWRGEAASLSPLDKVCAQAIAELRKAVHIEPTGIWGIGLRFFEKIGQSGFKSSLTPIIAAWMRAQWTRIVANESFRLARPRTTVPAIEVVLANTDNNGQFVASLLLVASEAIGDPLATAYRDQLERIAHGDKLAIGAAGAH